LAIGMTANWGITQMDCAWVWTTCPELLLYSGPARNQLLPHVCESNALITEPPSLMC